MRATNLWRVNQGFYFSCYTKVWQNILSLYKKCFEMSVNKTISMEKIEIKWKKKGVEELDFFLRRLKKQIF